MLVANQCHNKSVFLARLRLSFPPALRGPDSSPSMVGCGRGHTCPPGRSILQRVPLALPLSCPGPCPPTMALPPRSSGRWEHCQGVGGVSLSCMVCPWAPCWEVAMCHHCEGASGGKHSSPEANGRQHPLLQPCSASKGAGITGTGVPTGGFAAPGCMRHVKVPRWWGEPWHHCISIQGCCEHRHSGGNTVPSTGGSHWPWWRLSTPTQLQKGVAGGS